MATQHLPAPAAGMIGSRAGRVKDAYGAGYAGRAPARSLTRPPRPHGTGSYAGKGDTRPARHALQTAHQRKTPGRNPA